MPLPLQHRYSVNSNSIINRQTDTTASNSTKSSSPVSSFSEYHFDHALDLKYTEDFTSLSPEAFQFLRMDNREKLFMLHTPLNSKHNKKVLHDAHTDKPIFKMKLNHFGDLPIVEIIDTQIDTIAFTMKKTIKGRESINIWHGTDTDGIPALFTEGDLAKKRFRIWNAVDDEFSLAAVVRKTKINFSSLMSGRDTIMITVERDNNAALIAMVVAMVAEHWN